MFIGKIHNLAHLGLRHLPGKNSTHAESPLVNMQHNPGRFFSILMKEALQDNDDKLHRRVVVVQQQDFVKRRFLKLWLRLLNNRPF